MAEGPGPVVGWMVGPGVGLIAPDSRVGGCAPRCAPLGSVVMIHARREGKDEAPERCLACACLSAFSKESAISPAYRSLSRHDAGSLPYAPPSRRLWSLPTLYPDSGDLTRTQRRNRTATIMTAVRIGGNEGAFMEITEITVFQSAQEV